MKKAGLKMSLLMGATMSFCLSLIGNLSSGNFTLRGFLTSFLISFAISFLLGLLIPMKKISNSLISRYGLEPGSVKARLLEALVCDLSYSPLMTLVMILFAYHQATSHGARIAFLPMLLKAEAISLVAAFILSYLITPIYSRLIFKKEMMS